MPNEIERREKINHPSHYGGDTQYEVIKVIEAWGLEKNFYLAQVLRYVGRQGKKRGEPAIDDLKKALWYLQRQIARLEPQLK